MKIVRDWTHRRVLGGTIRAHHAFGMFARLVIELHMMLIQACYREPKMWFQRYRDFMCLLKVTQCPYLANLHCD